MRSADTTAEMLGDRLNSEVEPVVRMAAFATPNLDALTVNQSQAFDKDQRVAEFAREHPLCRPRVGSGP